MQRRWRTRGAVLLAAWLVAGGTAWTEPLEPPAPSLAAGAIQDGTHEELLRLFARLWASTDLAPHRPVALAVADGLAHNAVATPKLVLLARRYLAWASRLPPDERERVLARTLAHELAHVALGHDVASAANELASEALGILYFERAGFDCRWWVEYVRSARETEGAQGWPRLQDVVDHDTRACAGAREVSGRTTRQAAEGP